MPPHLGIALRFSRTWVQRAPVHGPYWFAAEAWVQRHGKQPRAVSARAAPTGVMERALAPDLARGVMLLFIALAHSRVFLYRGGIVDSSLADQLVVLARNVLVDGRAAPMFFFLFGYGLGQLLRRQEARGSDWNSVRKLLCRRGWWMLVIGLLHVALLFPFDVIAAYGLATVILVDSLRAPDKRLLQLAACLLVLVAVLGVGLARGVEPVDGYPVVPSMSEPNPFIAIGYRVGEWFPIILVLGWQIVPGMFLGIWAARRGVLDAPQQHRTLLVRSASIGVALAIVGGLPLGLISARFWPDPPGAVDALAGALHSVTGYVGGIGWAALIGLGAISLGRHPSPAVQAVAAVGQRSLSFYLFQSVVFAALLAPYAAGLGAQLGIAGSAAVAVATWLLSVAIAEAMRRGGYRGPAEVVLRRLTYGGRSLRGSPSST